MTAWAAIFSVSAPLLAQQQYVGPTFRSGDHESVGTSFRSGAQSAQANTQAGSTGPGLQPMSKTYLWAGSALFVGGMAVAINGFLNNRNGEFPEFGEAESTNVRMGAAGLGAAFAGGVLLFLGKERAARAPSITVSPGGIAVSTAVRW